MSDIHATIAASDAFIPFEDDMPKSASPPNDLLAPLAEKTLRAIAEEGIVRSFPKGAILISEGDTSESLYIVLSGRVKVYASNAAGREIVLSFFGPGEYVGEMSLDGSPRSASVMTVEPTKCAIITRASFQDFVLAHPDFAMHLIGKLIQRVRVTTENVKSLALSDVYGRLVRLITTLSVERNGVMIVPEKLTQQDIAERVGASRDMISRLLKDLVGGGYLAIQDRTITVVKKPPAGW
jgi:CRP/FNR family transcriptional regulator, cyclic AMP receptor protein